jgi:hypothetical protein
MAGADLQRVANARKATNGQYQGLLNPEIMAQKKSDEAKLREGADHDAWKEIDEALKRFAGFEREYSLLESGHAYPSELFTIARHLVRMSEELAKPNAVRLREYRDSNLESLQLQLFSTAPISLELERVKLISGLTFLAENLGGDHPTVRKLLDGKSPTARATELVAGTKLNDPTVRKKIRESGLAAINSSTGWAARSHRMRRLRYGSHSGSCVVTKPRGKPCHSSRRWPACSRAQTNCRTVSRSNCPRAGVIPRPNSI